ncbi:Peptide chain release factor 1 [Pelagimonas phthalicica]|uniref:Peptide chain release factor 1 n=1 Tax=Pelagimonas phthalicica TaxID=1037362 RepID=A0A238JHG0_9RHOB|nr:peptide chain release factor H [Pelagimonas phthalicica]TDS89934.1 peptide chain release factor [Pelagimonas phthalicica]SMX30101.1 Peptide chain release factor 1 [Pelagimonas phthalicica]
MSRQISVMVTSGNGPAECQLAAQHVVTRLQSEAEQMGVEVDISDSPSKHGILSAVLVLNGALAATLARQWIGTIRWRHQSPMRPHHKRANWFVAVFELEVARAGAVQITPEDVRFSTLRAGGPGGQHQNTTDSAVRAHHSASGLSVVVRDGRSQHQNRKLALERLQILANARAQADLADSKSAQNQLHHRVQRGNPLRCFKGPTFKEDKS